MSFLRNIKTRRQGLKKPYSNRERRLTILMVYSHGKTYTISCRMDTIVAIGAVMCLAIATLGFFVNSYMNIQSQNRELNYLYEVADIQEEKIREMQDYLADLADRLRESEISQSQTRSMLMQEGLINQSFEEAAIVASRRSAMGVVSRSGVDRRHPIPVQAMGSILVSLEEYASGLNTQLCVLEEQVDILNKDVVAAVDYARAQPNIWPVNGSITSAYGWRKHPVTRRHQFHEGIDISGQYGAPIKATADGTVTFVGYKTGYGRTIEINHGYGLKTLYCHCSSIKATHGQKVRRGDVIGYVGTSGVATGPHLHYEIHKNGKTQDPLGFLPK